MQVGPEDDLVAVVIGLRARGYEDAHAVEGGLLRGDADGPLLAAERLVVDATYRFEGHSNPDDSAIVLAVHARSGWKANVVAGYGPSASAQEADLLSSLAMGPR